MPVCPLKASPFFRIITDRAHFWSRGLFKGADHDSGVIMTRNGPRTAQYSKDLSGFLIEHVPTTQWTQKIGPKATLIRFHRSRLWFAQGDRIETAQRLTADRKLKSALRKVFDNIDLKAAGEWVGTYNTHVYMTNV
ncbi:hypothetical protein L596_029156 [Steinernema carpocapsae]|uniref:Uncharacterized protein n=1 Tax=Steinernema carpocapsae TaxID=34508 RepID=A0A4U5LTU2_STECR|nr:hypothetical protein L596_029156 [Steinernema carpocapsae]